ncbi:hypothetical protein ACIP5N_22030 [Streptomyces sp. NPDC088768]|uniref:hypothetical protein n=1 Tax=Streptomyces sp. NPDC088768 TaxID=3365894 RepID=UPI0037FA967E
MLDIEADALLSPPDAAYTHRLRALAHSLGVDPVDLDEAVHDAASQYASAAYNSGEDDDEGDGLHDEAGHQAATVNNGGLDRQVDYLVVQAGPEKTERIIREAVA